MAIELWKGKYYVKILFKILFLCLHYSPVANIGFRSIANVKESYGWLRPSPGRNVILWSWASTVDWLTCGFRSTQTSDSTARAGTVEDPVRGWISSKGCQSTRSFHANIYLLVVQIKSIWESERKRIFNIHLKYWGFKQGLHLSIFQWSKIDESWPGPSFPSPLSLPFLSPRFPASPCLGPSLPSGILISGEKG